MGKVMECPFCGNKTAPTILSTEDVWADILDVSETGLGLSYTVCCDAMSGGCGASCGYYETKRQAISAWNRRSNND